jgi:hypothetical protein
MDIDLTQNTLVPFLVDDTELHLKNAIRLLLLTVKELQSRVPGWP